MSQIPITAIQSRRVNELSASPNTSPKNTTESHSSCSRGRMLGPIQRLSQSGIPSKRTSTAILPARRAWARQYSDSFESFIVIPPPRPKRFFPPGICACAVANLAGSELVVQTCFQRSVAFLFRSAYWYPPESAPDQFAARTGVPVPLHSPPRTHERWTIASLRRVSPGFASPDSDGCTPFSACAPSPFAARGRKTGPATIRPLPGARGRSSWWPRHHYCAVGLLILRSIPKATGHKPSSGYRRSLAAQHCG
jgi:hypothetical protein